MPNVRRMDDSGSASPDWTFIDGDDYSKEFKGTPFEIMNTHEVKHTHGRRIFLTIRNASNT